MRNKITGSIGKKFIIKKDLFQKDSQMYVHKDIRVNDLILGICNFQR